MDNQLQKLLGGLQDLGDRLAMEGRFTDAAAAVGAIQAIRALRTKLEPPEAAAGKLMDGEPGEALRAALKSVPPEAEGTGGA